MFTVKKNGPGLTLGLLGSLLASHPALAAIEGYATLNGGTTGGAGGNVVYASTGTEINQAMCSRAADDTPLIIYVTGTINHGNTSKVSGSCDTTDSEIQFKRVSNISLIGTDQGALFDQIGIHIREASNIIIRNIHVRNVKKSGSPLSNGGDAIGMESDVHNIWVDHNELEASGGESDGYDALIDMKATTQYVTVSYNYLHHSGRGGLMGSSDSDTDNTYVTFHHNWYENVDSRMPLLRHGTAHAYNNYYNHISKSGMNPRIGGQIKAENNVFEDAQNPIGTFYTDDMGFWDVSGNIFTNVTWLDNDTNHPAGPNPVSTTSISIPYSYQLDDANCVKAIVLASAGVNNGLHVSDGSCSTQGGGDDNGSGGDNGGGGDDGSGGDNGGGSGELGSNLSLGAGSDGSSKGSGSYGDVRDGDMASYWAPSSATGRISIKWSSATSINTLVIREAAGFEGHIQNWTVVDNDTGNTLASGTGAGTITFNSVSTHKVNFNITSSNGTPTVAEFETYNVQ
ncbi:pectate lyase family protein [Gallaecimonas pentaromativorans]|uniref:Pectate lyase n=1 Tax=Gallaecimonas pentaromativorans TaxID=584787 RepID=A0A3N1PFX3_9GAMM|nr:pectate lyase [Gallaecimonas pentaromativorans]ROQ25907.1 pectate lyase [Gallaecimonas pentaromativorans]